MFGRQGVQTLPVGASLRRRVELVLWAAAKTGEGGLTPRQILDRARQPGLDERTVAAVVNELAFTAAVDVDGDGRATWLRQSSES